MIAVARTPSIENSERLLPGGKPHPVRIGQLALGVDVNQPPVAVEHGQAIEQAPAGKHGRADQQVGFQPGRDVADGCQTVADVGRSQRAEIVPVAGRRTLGEQHGVRPRLGSQRRRLLDFGQIAVDGVGELHLHSGDT